MYRAWYAPFGIILHVVFLVGAVVAAVSAGKAGIGFDVIFFLAIGLISWLNLYVSVFELRLEDGQLKWRAPLRSGAVPLNKVRSIRNVIPAWPWPVVRFEIEGQMGAFISGKRSLRAFVDRMAAESPDLRIDRRSYATWRHELWVM
jgi:hypothetical protein